MHFLQWNLRWSLGPVVWRSDVVGHVEVNVLAICWMVEARLLQLQWGRADGKAATSA